MPEISMDGDLAGLGVWVMGEGRRAEWILLWLKSILVSRDRLLSEILPLLLM